MGRTVRIVRQQPPEDVWVVAGEHGVVTAHLHGGSARSVVLHSPREKAGWRKQERMACTWMEMPCWYLASIYGYELAQTLAAICAADDEEQLWRLLEHDYQLYLGGGR